MNLKEIRDYPGQVEAVKAIDAHQKALERENAAHEAALSRYSSGNADDTARQISAYQQRRADRLAVKK